jgi:hypothetical protein
MRFKRGFCGAFFAMSTTTIFLSIYFLCMKHVMMLWMMLGLLQATGISQQNPAKESGSQGNRFALKAGYNIARVTGESINFKPASSNGFMAGLSFSPATAKGFGFRTELVFSRQGFGFSEAGVDHSVVTDYLYQPQFTTFNIGRLVQPQAGVQAGWAICIFNGRDTVASLFKMVNQMPVNIFSSQPISKKRRTKIGIQ